MNAKNTLITYIEKLSDLEKIVEIGQGIEIEAIVGTTLLSRFSNNSIDEMLNLAQVLTKNKIAVVLEWDALNQEDKFQTACELIDRLPLHDFKAIRVQDPGAVEYIKNKYPWLMIQLILENGNHNLVGLLKWCEYLGKQCERLVLSNELSKEKLMDYAKALPVALEVLTFGRILLFYSPRKLLSPLEKEKLKAQTIHAFGTSEESPHSGFPLIENLHGTFMFNVKDLYLLDQISEINEMGIFHQRVDLRFDESFELFSKDIFNLYQNIISEVDLTIRQKGVRPFIKGFYNINKTDVLFTKLKNKRVQRSDEFYIGEIVDVERDQALALLVKTDTLKNSCIQTVKMITPEGKEKVVELAWVKSSVGEGLDQVAQNELVLIPYINGVTVKTQVYLNSKT